MKKPNRDLLVLVNGGNGEGFENELEQLDKILVAAESVDSVSLAHEVFDLNRYKIHRKPSRVANYLVREFKPFVFLINKN
mgnify:CR=1 FL=1|jgi:hypothetical protein